MYVTLNFDVEDVVYPPEAGVDDIPGWLARTLTETGLRGTFYVIGDKARSMLERGCRDVFALMAEHDIGIHTDSSRHPLVPEIVEDCGWADGVEKLVAYEQRAAEAIKKAFWKWPVATSCHTCFTSPQSHGAAARLGLPYAYTYAKCPGHAGPVWYAGALAFPFVYGGGSTRKAADCYLEFGFDPKFSHDEPFEQVLGRLGKDLDRRVAEGHEYLTLFVGHPVRFRSKGWTECELYANGRNRTVADFGYAYELKTDAEMQRAQANFRRFCEALAARDDIEVICIARAAELFAPQPTHVGRDAMLAYCNAGAEPHLDPVYSPAEMLTALCESLVAEHGRGALPRAVERRNVLGPVEKPVVTAEKPFVTRDDLLELCRGLVAHVEETGHLPANLELGVARVGLGSLHAACVAAFAAECAGNQLARLRTRRAPRYPAFAEQMDHAMAGIEESGFIGPEFSADKLRLHARLQTWSLKPAHTSVPSGPYLEAGGFVRHDLAAEP